MNDKWYEAFGEAARQMANAPLSSLELGKTLEHIYRRMEQEAMRDAREEANRNQNK
jgi:hypothetical protein